MSLGALSVPQGIEGDPRHFPIQGTTTPGVEQTLINQVVPNGISRDIWQIVTSCAFEGILKVKVDGTLIGSGRTGPGRGTIVFPWLPQQNAQAGQTILVTFLARENSPSAPIEVYLMCADQVVS